MYYCPDFFLEDLLYFLTGDDRVYWANDDRDALKDGLRQALNAMLDTGILPPTVRKRMMEKNAPELARCRIRAIRARLHHSAIADDWTENMEKSEAEIKRNEYMIKHLEEEMNHLSSVLTDPRQAEELKERIEQCKEQIGRCRFVIEKERVRIGEFKLKLEDALKQCEAEIRRWMVIAELTDDDRK